MLLSRIPPQGTRVQRARARVACLGPGGAILLLLSLAACGDSSGPDGGGGGGGSATLSGTVRAAVGSAVLAGATISVGSKQATSDASGQFVLTDLPVGAASVLAERPGYLPVQTAVTLSSGANTRDFAMTQQEIFISGPNAVYLPPGVNPVRGVIMVLGGPVTSGFVTGERIAPAGNDELEASLQALGASLRALARSAQLGLFGSATTGMVNSAANDAVLFGVLGTVAGLSGRAEIEDAPILMVTLSAGSHEGAALVSRHPERAIGLLLRVPVDALSLTAPSALAVPTFVMQAELDVVVSNAVARQAFTENRLRGGLWALAVEPGATHQVATSQGNATIMAWLSTVLSLRLPAASGTALIALEETAGWLGDQTTLEIAAWADFLGDRAAASWLVSESVALLWKSLGTPGGGGS